MTTCYEWARLLLQPTILAVSAAAATTIGWRTLKNNRDSFQETAKANQASAVERAEKNRSIAKDRATIDFLFEHLEDGGAHKIVRKIYRQSETEGASYLRKIVEKPESDDEIKDKEVLMELLNHYEYMAIGLKHDIYNENILKECSRTTVIRYFIRLLPLIETLREKTRSRNTFCDLARLTLRWSESVPNGHDQTIKPTEIKAIKEFVENQTND